MEVVEVGQLLKVGSRELWGMRWALGWESMPEWVEVWSDAADELVLFRRVGWVERSTGVEIVYAGESRWRLCVVRG